MVNSSFMVASSILDRWRYLLGALLVGACIPSIGCNYSMREMKDAGGSGGDSFDAGGAGGRGGASGRGYGGRGGGGSSGGGGAVGGFPGAEDADVTDAAGGGAGAGSGCGPFTTICGNTTCRDLTLDNDAASAQYFNMACLQACCTASKECGSRLVGTGFATMLITGSGCIALDQPGVESAQCAVAGTGGDDAGTNPVGTGGILQPFLQLQGCCRPDGRCGLLLASFGMGCVANEDMGNVTSIFAGTVTPKKCTP